MPLAVRISPAGRTRLAPRSRQEERLAHCLGEAYRGSGMWPEGNLLVGLEPPFEPFSRFAITDWDLSMSGFRAPYQGRFVDRLKRLFLPRRARRVRPTSQVQERGPLHMVLVRPYFDDDVTLANSLQLLLALGSAREPIAFELFAAGPSRWPEGSAARIETRFVVGQADLPVIKAQLHGLYPRSGVTSHQAGFHDADHEFKECFFDATENPPLFVSSLRLDEPYCFPIRTFSTLINDPLSPMIAVMEQMDRGDWALFQVLFCRAKRAWAENLRLAAQDPYQPRHFLIQGLDHRTLSEKCRAPLYAASIRLAASTKNKLNSLSAWVQQYEGPHNRFTVSLLAAKSGNGEARYENAWRSAFVSRQVLAAGMLLNVEELAGIVHLPSAAVASERLLRVKSQTRQPPKFVVRASSGIGQNVHRGQMSRVVIPSEIRARHTYICGATGTGKSTLLTNMIIDDMAAGQGVGLLDPHGDLVKVVLRHIPRSRIDDVILFDAADTESPFRLNILEAKDETERERISAELVMALERYFPSSWGPRLERILQYTIRTVLHAIPGATLADVERLLTDEGFREETLQTTTDDRLISFWRTQFKFFPKNATDPVLNKLSVFLMDRSIRNIICQRRSGIDFDAMLNEGKILLANLSTGLLTEKVAGTLGSFLVTKIVNAAFRRASLPAERRRPWNLFIDEFQNFMNLGVGFERILAEARKVNLLLTAANQQVSGQLSQSVRQAIFGNVGSLFVFRLGVEDAQTVAKELGGFTVQDVLNLEVGQAIARVGGSSAAFNLQTFPEPNAPLDDPTRRIVELARRRYAKPRLEVERELSQVNHAADRLDAAISCGEEPSDPNEDDLVA